MTAIVNLNKARKARAKAGAKVGVAENRVRFGRTRAEREAAETREDKARRELDAHKRGD